MPDFNRHDTINLLSKLTFRRLFNGMKVLGSYYLSKWTKKAIQWGYPVSISFEPTTSCNLRCPECPSGLRAFTRPTGMLENSFFRQTIDQLSKDLLYLVFYFQGEPYLNPSFLDMVAYASSKGIYTATSTNAHYLNDRNAKRTVESGLDRLIISIDGQAVDDSNAFDYRFATKALGGTARLGIVRSGRETTANVILETAPESAHDELVIGARSPFTGVKVSSISPALADELRLDPSAEGVVVLDVSNGSLAQTFGFRKGDIVLTVNNQKIANPRDLERATAQQSRVWRITIRRGGQQMSVVLSG